MNVDAANLLPLPGLVDVRTVEQRVRLLREAKLPYMFAVAVQAFRYELPWAPFGQQEDMSGLPYLGIEDWTSVYFLSPAHPQWLGLAQAMIRGLYQHFGDDPLFCGWVTPTDIFFVEQEGRWTEFSPPMVQGFGPWLREQKGVTTLAALNARYGIRLTSRDHVDPALPPWPYYGIYTGAPGRLEHQSWRDYWEYRMWMIRHLQYDGMVRFARALGDRRPFGCYGYYHGQDEESYLPDLKALGGFTTFGTEGKPGYAFITEHVLRPLAGAPPFVAEYQALLPGYKDIEEKNPDRLLATIMLAGGQNLNFTMFRNRPFSATIPGTHKGDIVARALDRQQQWIEVLPPFAQANIYPWEMGCYSARESAGGNIAQYLWPAYPNYVLKSYFSDAMLAAQKLIFVARVDGGVHNPDFTPAMQQQLVRYVRQGGKLVLISPDSARYTRDNPFEQFALLTALGWPDRSVLMPPPEGEITVTNSGLFTSAGTLKLAGLVPYRCKMISQHRYLFPASTIHTQGPAVIKGRNWIETHR